MSTIHNLERMVQGGWMIQIHPSVDGSYRVSINVAEKEFVGTSNFSLVLAIEAAEKSFYDEENAESVSDS